jgi:hypothetical protein
MSYHCTWHKCERPIFSLTLCRGHYRAAHVKCLWPNCDRPSFCKQVCRYHYRKKMFLPLATCSQCDRSAYMSGKCFYHFTHRSCVQCGRRVFSKRLCRRHYMRVWRENHANRGSTTNIDSIPETTATTPDATHHIPVNHSS